MATKRIAFEREARDAIRSGVSKLAKAVKATMGPRGHVVMIERGFGAPLVTKDGVTVAKEIELSDTWENMGAQMVREVAVRTSDDAGDGTTTATVLAEAIFERGLLALQSGVQPVHLKRGIEKAAEAVVTKLKELSRDVSGVKQVSQVGAIAANNDEEIGRVLAEAMERVGKDGVITVDEGATLETQVEFVEGMSFDRGYLSPYFVTDPERMACELEDPLVLLYDGKISAVRDLVPVLELTLEQQRPLAIIADDVEGDCLALLVVNKLRGSLKVCAVKSPGFGDKKKAMLEDIAAVTGGRMISKEVGLTLEGVTLEDLGQCAKLTARKDECEVVGGHGTREAVKACAAQARAEIEANTSTYDREKLEERLAKLSGGVARLLVGASTEPEMKEKKARVEDAIHATRAAVAEGILPGAGVALLRAAQAITALKLEGDEEIGARIVRDALEAPARQIAENAGVNPSVVIDHVLANSDPNYGFNAQSLEYGDLVEAGVIDPTKVTRTAFQNAVSVTTLLLTTDCLVAEIKVEQEEDEHAGHMH